MRRPKLRIIVDGQGGPRARLLEALREMGYTVNVDAAHLRPSVTAADVLAPHGEVEPLPAFARRRT